MTIDEQIRQAQHRLHRSIGQKARHAHAEIQFAATLARIHFAEPTLGGINRSNALPFWRSPYARSE